MKRKAMPMYKTGPSQLLTFPKANPLALREWMISINNWIVSASIGIWPNESKDRQEIRITLHSKYLAPQPLDSSTVQEVVCYDTLMQSVQGMLEARHYYLVETLCEAIAQKAFEDRRVV